MSGVTDLSPDMIEAIYAEEAEPTAILITLASTDLAIPIRASSDPDGTTSRGDDYEYFPFSFTFGGASQSEPSKPAQLEISNSDARISEAVRGLPAGAQLFATCELVRIDDPDEVELAMTHARIGDIELDDPKATASIMPRTFDTEPACSPRYIGSRTPGLE